VSPIFTGFWAHLLADIDGARPRQLAGHRRADQCAAEHAVGDTLLEHGRGVLGIQVHRVVVAGHRGEQLDVALFDGLAVAGGLADFKGFVRGVGNLGHLCILWLIGNDGIISSG
jgi:hypothetical protein